MKPYSKTAGFLAFVAALAVVFVMTPLRAQQPPNPFSLFPQGIGLTQKHYTSAASTNSTLVAAGSHVVYAVNATNTASGTVYLKFYNKATAPTCGTDPVVLEFVLVQSKPIARLNIFGNAFPLGIGFCATGAFADSDTTNAATGTAIDVIYK